MKLSLIEPLLITFFVLLSSLVSGQKIRFYNSENGLPNSLIYKVSQDSRGYIWIASDNGVSYFDGMRFTIFNHETDKPGTIINDQVKAVFTDSKGVTWVGTANGLQIFESNTNAFRDFPLQYPSFTGTPYVTSITESKDREKLLVSVAGCGILVYDEATQLIDIGTTNKLKEIYGTNYLGTLVIDSEGYLWTYAEQGYFFRIDLQNKTVYKLRWDPKLEEQSEKIVVSAISEDPVSHNVLIGTYNHGLFIYDYELGYIRRPKGKAFDKFRIRSLLAESQKGYNNQQNIWVGTEDSGLKLFGREQENIITPDFQYAPIDLNNCKVHSLMQDSQGNIWAGIFQKGLLAIPKATNNFEYMKLSVSPGSMSVNVASATSITRDKSGNLWVGTDGGGLFSISENGTRTRYTRDNTPLPNNAVLTLATDKRGTLWISTYMGGITTYNSKTGFKTYSKDVELQKVICSLYDEKNDKLYMGTLGHGIKVLSFSNNKIEAFPEPGALSWISSLNLDSSGNLWVGFTDGLQCYHTLSGKIIYPELADEMKGISVNTLIQGVDSSVWIGTGNGLLQFKKDNQELTRYSKAEGLAGNIVCSIQESNNGMLWISTMNGLSQFNLETKSFRNFNAYDGLQDNEFRTRATFKDSDGKLFFGGINGVTAFYPNEITHEEQFTSKIYFSQLLVLNKTINYDEALGDKNMLDRHISQASQITLKKSQNVFSLEFAVLEYTNPKKVGFGYMLNGFDSDWRYTDSDHRLATYTNLPEGAYVFKVKAFFEGSSDNTNVVYNEINIRILPPWYKTWWAYLIYLSLFMLLVWEFLNFLIRRKLRIQEHNELEKKEMKLRMFTDLSHEIRTPLTLIMTPLQSLRETETDSQRKDIFNLMYRNSLRILRLFNQILDIRKIEKQQLNMQFQKTDLIFFINDIMQSFSQLAILRNIDFRLVASLSSLELWIDQVNFDKVLFNILSNAFKFTPDNGYILISIDTCKNTYSSKIRNDIDEYIEICIENSGSKINENEVERVFDRFYQSRDNTTQSGSGIGLHLAKMIVQLHHGNIQAQNVENGVAFNVQIPLGKKHLAAQEILSEEKTTNLYAHLNYIQNGDTEYLELSQMADHISIPDKQKQKRSLIIIDDDYDLGKYLQMALSGNYLVDFFIDAKAAWKEISTALPDAVITDLVMAEVDGLSLCKKIRQNPETNHIPVIILTSQTDEESKRLCLENGADHYLTKPISIELLRTSIAQVIHSRDMLRNKFKTSLNTGLDNIKISSPDNRLVAKVIETIRKNIENSAFGVDDLSSEVGLSRVHLNRKLKENLNISPSNLIRSIRLKQAAYLLINNKVNISEVAYKVGFSSHSYFSNNFKEYFGMAPTEFIIKYTESEGKEAFSKLFEE